MCLDTASEGSTGELHDLESELAHLWSRSFSVNCNPDFGRVLGAEFMKPKSREEANDAMRYPLGDLRESEIARDPSLRKRVNAASDSHKQAFLLETAQMLGMNSLFLQISYPEYPGLSHKVENLFLFGPCFCHV